MNTSFKSSSFNLLLRGQLWDAFIPWTVEVDTDHHFITVRKRNWYLIGVDENKFKFNSVKHIEIDQRLFGTDMFVRMHGSSLNIPCLKRRAANELRDLIMS
ncbi:MAG: hypothetical protein EOO61_00045 [Hymenobacter sp.]|nr:MAG: hypothetical protein EOO61_00045 [Hymenobacter sp.]